jgi:hypothetical protein
MGITTGGSGSSGGLISVHGFGGIIVGVAGPFDACILVVVMPEAEVLLTVKPEIEITIQLPEGCL